MTLFKEDDVFGYKDANEIKKFWANETVPDSETAEAGEIYLDIGSVPYRLKRYDGAQWETIGGVPAGTIDPLAADSSNGDWFLNTSTTPPKLKRFNSTAGIWQDIGLLDESELLNGLKNVDGNGSGLDADLLDGVQGSSFLRADTNDSFSGSLTSTISAETAVEFSGADSRITIHDGFGNFNFKSGVDDDNIITGVDGGSHIYLGHNGSILMTVSSQPVNSTFSSSGYIQLHNSNGIIMYGNVSPTHLVLPLSAPADLSNGSMWIE
jgi:hypothetical protein